MGSLGPSGSNAVEARRGLLASALSEAAVSWGRFDLPLERFAEKAAGLVARRLARSGVAATPENVQAVLARAPLSDLALAIACSEGARGSWEALVGRLSPRLVGLARKHGAAEEEAATLAADVLAEMSAPASRGATRRLIDTYEGAGSLFGWAAVILVRRLHRARLRRAGGAVVAREAGREEAADRGRSDPLDALADEDTVRRFRTALATAWAELSGRERLALTCRHLSGVPQTRIATLLGVSEPHTSRILAAAVARLRAAIEQALGAEAKGVEAAWPALVEVLRRHLVSTGAGEPHPFEDTPRARGRS